MGQEDVSLMDQAAENPMALVAAFPMDLEVGFRTALAEVSLTVTVVENPTTPTADGPLIGIEVED